MQKRSKANVSVRLDFFSFFFYFLVAIYSFLSLCVSTPPLMRGRFQGVITRVDFKKNCLSTPFFLMGGQVNMNPPLVGVCSIIRPQKLKRRVWDRPLVFLPVSYKSESKDVDYRMAQSSPGKFFFWFLFTVSWVANGSWKG